MSAWRLCQFVTQTISNLQPTSAGDRTGKDCCSSLHVACFAIMLPYASPDVQDSQVLPSMDSLLQTWGADPAVMVKIGEGELHSALGMKPTFVF